MKKIYTLAITLLLGAGALTSCVDLNQPPKSFISDEDFFAQDGAALKSVPGLYWTLWKGNYEFNCRLMRLNTQADDITISPTKAGNLLSNMYNLSPTLMANVADFESMWANFLDVINESNRLIVYTQIPDNNDTKTIKLKEIVGEAYFMRALSYLYLVRIFGDCPMLVHPKESYATMPRVGVKTLYEEMIIPSLKNAIDWLPEVSRTKDSSSPSKAAAKVCLADAYMNMAGWPLKQTEMYAEAAKLAEEVINSNRYDLIDDYAELWKENNKTNPKEFIFALHHSVANKVASQYGKSFYPVDFYPNAGWADYYGSLEFYNNYPNDSRKDWNYMIEWEVKDNETKEVKLTPFNESKDKLPAIAKYYDYDNGAPGKSQLSNGVTSIYRFADVLLIYAEASAKSSNAVNSLALESLNRVQRRAHSDITTTQNVSEFTKAVFEERGWEFFAEGRRWFDLVRLEKVSEYRSNVWNSSLYQKNNHYYYAIPQAQIDLTHWDNNPGY